MNTEMQRCKGAAVNANKDDTYSKGRGIFATVCSRAAQQFARFRRPRDLSVFSPASAWQRRNECLRLADSSDLPKFCQHLTTFANILLTFAKNAKSSKFWKARSRQY